MVHPIKGVHCIGGKNPPLSGSIAQDVGASTPTGSPTSIFPTSESSVNTFQAGFVKLPYLQATLTQVKAKLPLNNPSKQARDIGSGSKMVTRRLQDPGALFPSPLVPCTGKRHCPLNSNSYSSENPHKRRRSYETTHQGLPKAPVLPWKFCSIAHKRDCLNRPPPEPVRWPQHGLESKAVFSSAPTNTTATSSTLPSPPSLTQVPLQGLPPPPKGPVLLLTPPPLPPWLERLPSPPSPPTSSDDRSWVGRSWDGSCTTLPSTHSPPQAPLQGLPPPPKGSEPLPTPPRPPPGLEPLPTPPRPPTSCVEPSWVARSWDCTWERQSWDSRCDANPDARCSWGESVYANPDARCDASWPVACQDWPQKN